ncbi:MAG: NAD(P)H-dependent oxidoreductase [Lagierella massiliensis]|nr:NAD(P)H-dependent oxidoreductase [Lagierella massiliensis]
MKVGIIVGSLRKESWNMKVAKEVKEMFENAEADIIDIKNLPLYNSDLDGENAHEEYTKLRNSAKEHDAFLFITPEYNRTMTPAIKNAIDIGSTAPGGNVWAKKPAAVFSASISGFGAMAGNLSLRQSLVYVDLIPMQQPEIYLAKVQDSFDENGNMTDRTKNYLKKAVKAFEDHIERLTK